MATTTTTPARSPPSFRDRQLQVIQAHIPEHLSLFPFRRGDVGKPKASVAAAFINRRFGHLGARVTPHVGKIQDLPRKFFKQVGGVDVFGPAQFLCPCWILLRVDVCVKGLAIDRSRNVQN